MSDSSCCCGDLDSIWFWVENCIFVGRQKFVSTWIEAILGSAIELWPEIPRLQTIRNVLRFSHMENSWKKRVHVYTTLQGNPRRTFYIRSSETERDVQAQMEDGFGEALLTRFERDKRNANVPFNGYRQVMTGPPVIAERYRNCCTWWGFCREAGTKRSGNTGNNSSSHIASGMRRRFFMSQEITL